MITKELQNVNPMSEAAKEAQNEYQREYRRRNKEKVKQWNKNYWERRAKKSENENKEIEKA